MSHPRLVLIHSIAKKSRLDANRVRYLSRIHHVRCHCCSFILHTYPYPWRVAGALIAAMPPLHQLNGKIIDNRLSCFHSWVPRRATNSTSLIDSHWAWRAYPVSLLCFVLLIRMARRRNEVILRWSAIAGSMSGRGGSTPPHRLVLSIFGSWSSSQHSGVSPSREYVVKYDPVLIESMLGLIVKKRCVLITNRSNRCCSPQCFNLWQRVAIHRRVGIVLYDSWWRDGIVIVRPSLIHSVS